MENLQLHTNPQTHVLFTYFKKLQVKLANSLGKINHNFIALLKQVQAKYTNTKQTDVQTAPLGGIFHFCVSFEMNV